MNHGNYNEKPKSAQALLERLALAGAWLDFKFSEPDNARAIHVKITNNAGMPEESDDLPGLFRALCGQAC